MQGVLYTPAMVMEEGGLLDGQIVMQGNSQTAE